MLTVAQILEIEKEKIARRQPSEEDLRRIPLDRPARIFGRLSDPKQVQESLQSMAELADLVRLASRDGFRTELSLEEVERRLEALKQKAPDALHYWVDGQVIVDLRDLGISGRLGPEKRPALANLMADLSHGEGEDVTGAIYLSSEGVSRLSRDQDRIVGAQLLKLMKQSNCRLRTPYAVFNPRIEADWKELREGFEDAARQSQHLQKNHFGPRKRTKALRGEHVGNKVPPGFIVEIKGYKSNGSYIFGKWAPYPPHVEIVLKILREYVRCNGSKYTTAQALRGTVFPFFPEELKYMETRTAFRDCLRTSEGYIISPELIDGLTRQVALVGTWKWTDILIENNHPAIVPLDLFGEVYALNRRHGDKPKGRAAHYEPLDWDGLLQCMNHETPRRISGHASDGKWVCDSDYHNATGPICLKIDHRFIDKPLTTEFLKCLDLSSNAAEVLKEIQDRTASSNDQQVRRKHEEANLNNRLSNLENYLGASDPELEESYRRQIRQVKGQIQALRQKPLPPPVTVVDINRVRRFLENIENEWGKLPSRLRNNLLKLLIERVEVTHDLQKIEAVIIWKVGFKQKIVIERPVGNSRRDRWWTEEQDRILRRLWPAASREEMMAALPGREWRAIQSRAGNLKLSRKVREYPLHWKPWTAEDDARLAELYVKEPTNIVAAKLGRGLQSVNGRAWLLKIRKPLEILFPEPNPVWESLNAYGFERLCSLLPPSPIF